MSHHRDTTTSTRDDPVRVVLVMTVPQDEREQLGDRIHEMTSLLDTAGANVVATVSQHLARPVSSTYIGSGKIEEVRQAAEVHQADEIVFDAQLSPSQERNLEKHLKRKVIDYTGLILHIFAGGARTHQAKLAVELAQLEYNRSRLKRLWSHLDRIKAGMNMRGPGEKQLEVDRRLVDKRIADLKRELAQIEDRKERAIQARDDAFKVCLVGYTNAGKSTLMNALTGAGVLAKDRLFATLDTRTKRLVLDQRHNIVLSDTVGFIRNLPHHLVASFHATLAEVREADLLLHVVDASLPSLEEQIAAVEAVLERIAAQAIPTVMVFNKVDQDHSHTILLAFKRRYPDSVCVSAKTGVGLDDLRAAIRNALERQRQRLVVRFPASDGAMYAFLQRTAVVLDESFDAEEARLTLEADAELEASLRDNPKLHVVTDRPPQGGNSSISALLDRHRGSAGNGRHP